MDTREVQRLLPPHVRVGRRLGTGAFATVWDARDVRCAGIAMALKLGRGPTESARLRMEAYICRRAFGAHIPRVFEVGDLDEQHSYLLMERFDGFDLESILERGPLSIGESVEVVEQLLVGLQRVHSLGVVHKDVKPGNVMVAIDRQGSIAVKLIDFGIAAPFARAVRPASNGLVVGTPAYMAPEQLRGEPLDARCDVYSAGAVLYELITGRPPFWGVTVTDVVRSALHDPILDPTGIDDRVPNGVANVVMRALARSRSERYPSCEAMRADLARRSVGMPQRPRLLSGYRFARSVAPTLLDTPKAPSRLTETAPFLLVRVHEKHYPAPIRLPTRGTDRSRSAVRARFPRSYGTG